MSDGREAKGGTVGEPDVRRLEPLRAVRGRLRVPGDKSISHRALLFAAIADGTSRIEGLAPGDDVRTTRRLIEALGVPVSPEGRDITVRGAGWSALDRPAEDDVLELDCGNSGTTARLSLGLLAGRRGRFRLSGDVSLSRRPMGRVVRPLAQLGARLEGGDRLPLEVVGTVLRAGQLRTGVASAQVKSALILAALQADGESVVRELTPTRDHTERMLRAMGGPVEPTDGGWRISGGTLPLRPLRMRVPGDPSSAAYALALACLLPESKVEVESVSLNPTRLGFVRIVRRMGAELHAEEVSPASVSEEPEPIGSIAARSSSLRPLGLTEADVTDAIDEIPLIAAMATRAEGETVIRGAGELRRKESDRISATVALLRAFGAEVDELEDGMRIVGPATLRGARVDAAGDHRIAMCATVLAALADGPSELSDASWVNISYPGFFDDLADLSG